MTDVDPDQVERRLRALGASVSAWGNGPGDRYPVHVHDFDKILVVTQGDVTFLVQPSGPSISLSAGDRLDLPAGTSHGAVVGSAGVRCIEGHLPAKPSGALPGHVAGWAVGVPDPAHETAGDTRT